eukprot:1971707-Pleurochrysis_carterae.AAC.1
MRVTARYLGQAILKCPEPVPGAGRTATSPEFNHIELLVDETELAGSSSQYMKMLIACQTLSGKTQVNQASRLARWCRTNISRRT